MLGVLGSFLQHLSFHFPINGQIMSELGQLPSVFLNGIYKDITPSSSRLEKILYNQALVAFFKESVTTELFDKTNILTEIYDLHDMMPTHLLYFAILFGTVYSQRDMIFDYLERYRVLGQEEKYMYLLPNAANLKRNVHVAILAVLFFFIKDVDRAT